MPWKRCAVSPPRRRCAVDRLRRLRVAGGARRRIRQAALAFPADTAVLAVGLRRAGASARAAARLADPLTIGLIDDLRACCCEGCSMNGPRGRPRASCARRPLRRRRWSPFARRSPPGPIYRSGWSSCSSVVARPRRAGVAIAAWHRALARAGSRPLAPRRAISCSGCRRRADPLVRPQTGGRASGRAARTVTGWKDLYGRAAGRVVPQPARARAGRLPGRHAARRCASPWRERPAPPPRVVSPRDGLLRAAFGRPVTSEPPWHRAVDRAAPRRDRRRGIRSALQPRLDGVALAGRAPAGAAPAAARDRGARLAAPIVLRHAARGARRRDAGGRRDRRRRRGTPRRRGPDPEVLRSGTGPELGAHPGDSPLSEYRAHFADDAFDEVLFRVEPAGRCPSASASRPSPPTTASCYRALDVASSTADARFTRVPSRLPPAPGDADRRARHDRRPRGIWMPTAGRTDRRSTFDGPRAAALADGFYYNRSTAGAVQVAGGGLEAGDAYTIEAVGPPCPRSPTSRRPGAARLTSSAPASPGHLARAARRGRRTGPGWRAIVAPSRARLPQPCPLAVERRAPRVGRRARRLLVPAQRRRPLAGAHRRALPQLLDREAAAAPTAPTRPGRRRGG